MCGVRVICEYLRASVVQRAPPTRRIQRMPSALATGHGKARTVMRLPLTARCPISLPQSCCWFPALTGSMPFDSLRCSWVFCHSYPQCWSLDTGNWHGFGECWLKWQHDTKHPLYGQRGKFSDEFRKKHWSAHMTGLNPDGTRRNLTVPTHVPWTGGVMGTTYDPTIKWTTGLDGMSSNKGEQTVLWRAWETREENLARGVTPESMGRAWGSK